MMGIFTTWGIKNNNNEDGRTSTDPGEGSVRVRAVVIVDEVERFVALVVDVAAQVVAVARQFAGVRARAVVDGRHDADGQLSGSAADGHDAESHRRRHLRHKHRHRRRK